MDGRRLDPVDEVVAVTGFRPDLSWLSEVRLDLDPVLQAPRALAPLIDPNVHSCGTVYPHGAAELAQPEPGVYLVGMKSYGRAPTFLAMTGYEQVRSVAAAIAGDHEAAARVELVLPETGVCGGAGLFDTDRRAAAAAAAPPPPGRVAGSSPARSVFVAGATPRRRRPAERDEGRRIYVRGSLVAGLSRSPRCSRAGGSNRDDCDTRDARRQVNLEGNDVRAYRACFDLPPVETAPLIARTLVRTSLTAWGATELVDAAVLVVSEMVTNAVVHVGGTAALELRIERHGQEVHLALADGSSVRPLARELEDDDPHGRGIHLIEAVADRWETRDHQGGKQVWVALRDPLEAAPERE